MTGASTRSLRGTERSSWPIGADLAACSHLTANGRPYVATAVQAMPQLGCNRPFCDGHHIADLKSALSSNIEAFQMGVNHEAVRDLGNLGRYRGRWRILSRGPRRSRRQTLLRDRTEYHADRYRLRSGFGGLPGPRFGGAHYWKGRLWFSGAIRRALFTFCK